MSYCFKITVLAEICLKCVIFIKKLHKLPNAGGRPPCLQPPASGSWGLSPRPPMASGSSEGLAPDPQWPLAALGGRPRLQSTSPPLRNPGYATG